ncbi:hypothetical protein V8C44DRAFT_318521 [Trichoderma aethiopicum]
MLLPFLLLCVLRCMLLATANVNPSAFECICPSSSGCMYAVSSCSKSPHPPLSSCCLPKTDALQEGQVATLLTYEDRIRYVRSSNHTKTVFVSYCLCSGGRCRHAEDSVPKIRVMPMPPSKRSV